MQKVDAFTVYYCLPCSRNIQYRMIYKWLSNVIAALADGRVVSGRFVPFSPCRVLWRDLGLADVNPKQICSSWSAFTIRTNDNRILAGCESTDLCDITTLVQNLLQEDIANIRGFCIRDHILIIWTDYSIGTVNLYTRDTKSSSHSFQYGIDLVCIGKEYGFVKANGRLYVALDRELKSPQTLRANPDPPVIDFFDTNSILEMYSQNSWLMLLMRDGRVYVRDFCRDLETGLFTQILFPDKEIITKVVALDNAVFYITEQSCYLTTIAHERDRNMAPTRIPELDGRPVQNAYTIGRGYDVAVQYSGGGLCLLNFSRVSGTYRIDKITQLPFFDDKEVLAVTNLNMHAGFVTTEGHAYWFFDTDLARIEIVRDTFFDSKPLATTETAMRIRSARSIHNANEE